jgi:hypothetical protein
MSLIPSSVQGASGDNYFMTDVNGIASAVTIVPTVAGNPAALGLNNQIAGANAMNAVQFCGIAGSARYEIDMYGPSVGGTNVGLLLYGQGLGNGTCSLVSNDGGPLDASRVGKITGTGAPQVIACPSILVSSNVSLAFVGGTPAAADVPVTIVPNTSFSVTLPLGAVYNYTVVG